MTERRSEFLRIVTERGFFHQCTDADALDGLLAGAAPVTAYVGFDCTARSEEHTSELQSH